jgi:hypothetical protein
MSSGQQVPADGEVELHHSDRIIIASSHFFRINIPAAAFEGKRYVSPERYTCLRPPTRPRAYSIKEELKDYKYAKEELEQVQTARYLIFTALLAL